MAKVNSAGLWDKLLFDTDYTNSPLITRERISAICDVLVSKGTVLNIGSGQGYLEYKLTEMIENGFYEWYSLDITEVGLKNIKRISEKINTVEGNILDLPFNNKSFDYLVASEVLEHLDKKIIHKAYEEMWRVLKGDGKLIISVPIYEHMPLKKHPVGHYRKHIPKTILAELKNNGYKIVSAQLLFAFQGMYWIKSLIADRFKLRRHNVIVVICEKL